MTPGTRGARFFMGSLLAIAVAILVPTPTGGAEESEVWTFDRLDRLGPHPTTVLGHPRVIDTAIGKAVAFDGMGDALLVDAHPLAGAAAFTWEAIFRPDGGAPAQRWFHLQESGSDDRLLFEIRVIDRSWYLDSYLHSGDAQQALMNRERLHPLGAWYHVAAVYDGREFRNYVDRMQEGAAAIRFTPQQAGRASVGVRINLVDYFTGAVHLARFTHRALSPAEFLRVPGR